MWEMIAAWCGVGWPRHGSLDDVVSRYNGVLIPAEPSDEDCTIAYFRSVRDALDAALEAVTTEARASGCSVAVAVGEVETNADRVWGPPFDEACRLIAGRDAGVFVTEAARLVVPAERYRFKPSQKSGSAAAVELVGNREVTSPEPSVRLPPSVAADPEFPLVSRSVELAIMEEALEAVSKGQHRVILVAGEAGSGKSRLTRELAAMGRDRLAAVLYGRCREGAERAFLPFAEAISEYLGLLPNDERANLTDSIDEDLAPLLAARLAPSDTPETDQHWMLQAVSTLLGRVAERRPVVMILEDVHLAGRPTQTLLKHLSQSAPTGVVLIVTFRDAPSDLGGEVGTVIEAIGRGSTVRRCSLQPLSPEDVADLVKGHADIAIDDVGPLVDVLYERAEGNPLLTVELWLHLRRSSEDDLITRGRQVGAPASIVELATQQLRALPSDSRPVVEVGATMGADIDLERLASVLDCSVDSLVSRAIPAVEARLLTEDRPGRLRFVHSLIADSIAQSLPLDTRLRHHRSVVTALDQEPEADLVLVAHHALSAVPLISADEAVHRSEIAARAAMRSVAFGDAITVLDRALGLNVTESQRARLLLAVGQAAAIGGDAGRCVDACGRAATIGRDQDDPSVVRDAALISSESVWTRTSASTASAMSLLEEAIAASRAPRERTRLLAALTSIAALGGREERSIECGQEALDLARELDDEALLLDALHRNMFGALKPENADKQLELTREAGTLAERVGDDRLSLRISAKTLVVLTSVCEPSWLARELDHFDRLASRLREPLYLMTNEGFRALQAVSEGRLQDAERLAERANERWPNETGYGLQMFSIRREQDRVAELRPVLEIAAKTRARGPAAWIPGLAVVYTEVGMLSEARSLLNDLVQDDLAMVARDSLFPGVMSYLADVAVATGDRAAAERIHDHLAPYGGMLVTFPGVVSYGSADRYLGRLCEAMGHARQARDHLERAVDVDAQMGWTTWAAHSRFELGRHLVANGDPSDLRVGLEHIRHADRAARSARLVALRRKCRDQLGDSSESKGSSLLTKRELEVLGALAEGRTNREIGERIGASRHTVANHVRAILAKTGTANRTEAARWAHRRGLLQEESGSNG